VRPSGVLQIAAMSPEAALEAALVAALAALVAQLRALAAELDDTETWTVLGVRPLPAPPGLRSGARFALASARGSARFPPFCDSDHRRGVGSV